MWLTNRLLYALALFFAGVSLMLMVQLRMDGYPGTVAPTIEESALLREYAYRRYVVAYPQIKIASTAPLSEFLAGYEAGTLGGYCGQAALFYLRVLEANHVGAYYLDMGIPNTSHVVNLVQIKVNGREIWSVQDAYFNTILVDSAGVPLDYFAVLDLLHQRRHEDIIVSQGTTPARRTLCEDGTCYAVDTWDMLLARTDWQPLFDYLGEDYPHDWRYLYLVVYSVYGRDDSAMLAQIERAGVIRSN
jgi:hypothetical protein